MADSGSGSSGYASKGSAGKGSYSGGSALKGGYVGNSMKGIYGKGGLAAYLSGYGKRGPACYSTEFGKSYLSSRISDSYLKEKMGRFYSEIDSKSSLKDKLYSEEKTDRILREFLRKNPHYFERAHDPDEKIERCPFCGGQIGKCFCRN